MIPVNPITGTRKHCKPNHQDAEVDYCTPH